MSRVMGGVVGRGVWVMGGGVMGGDSSWCRGIWVKKMGVLMWCCWVMEGCTCPMVAWGIFLCVSCMAVWKCGWLWGMACREGMPVWCRICETVVYRSCRVRGRLFLR